MNRTLLLLAAVLPLALPACTKGLGAGRPPRADAVRGEDVPELAYRPEALAGPKPAPTVPLPPRPVAEPPGKIAGTPSIRVLWEALAIEMRQATGTERGVLGSSGLVEGLPGTRRDVDFEAVLLNASFSSTPEQDAENRGEKAVGRVARVTDQQMNDLLASLESLGFYRYARRTEEVRGMFAGDRARGRVTVDRGGESWTLLSMWHQGLNPETKEIPGIYSRAKLAVITIKNMTPVVRVKSVDVEPLHPPSVPAGGGGSGK